MVKDAYVKKRNDDGTFVLGCDSNECSGCKSKLFCTQKDTVFTATNVTDEDLSDADVVKVEIGFAKSIAALAIVFIIPLAFMGGALFASYYSGLSGVLQAVLSILGLVFGLALSALVSHFTSRKLRPAIIGRSKSDCPIETDSEEKL